MYNYLHTPRNVFAWLTLLGLVVAPHARAEILQIDARLSAEVQEFVAGEEGSFDSAFEEFGTTSAVLPIQVAARLLPPEDTGTNGFVAGAVADFRDPAASLTPNPGEFGLETHTSSAGPERSFLGRAVATEKRGIIFSAEELDRSADESERPVRSSVFVSGAAVIWSEDPARDLTGLSVTLQIVIEQQVPDADPVTVFEALLTVEGAPNGQVTLHSPDGILAVLGGPDLITAAAGYSEDELLEELAALGHVHLVLIPEQELTYSYTAPEDVEFAIEADVEARVVNVPGGTGVGAVFGRSFEALVQALSGTVHTRTKGAATQAAVNAALANTATVDASEPEQGRAFASPASPCGVIGVGTLAMTFALFLVMVWVRRFG